MIRRELYSLVRELAANHRPGGTGSTGIDQSIQRTILDAFALTLRRRRGIDGKAVGGKVETIARELDRPELDSLFQQDDALGRIYQALNAPALEAAYRATTTDRRRFTEAEIPAVTQLFTPGWVAEFLVQNTLGRLWMEWHPDSGLAEDWQWLLDRGTGFQPVLNDAHGLKTRATEIRGLDPSCGTMNFGLVAVDMLAAMYREEMDRAGKTGWPEPSVRHEREIPAAIAKHNLVGVDIDPVALDLARQSLELKLGKQAFDLRQADALLDESMESWLGKFDVVATNPPYLSARNLPGEMLRRIKHDYPASARDLYACFIDRSLQLLKPGGRAGILCMHSFMFTGSYEKLRAKIGDSAAIEAIAHLGPGLFEVGNPGTLQTVAMVLRREEDAQARAKQAVAGFRLVDLPDESAKRQALGEIIHRRQWHEIEQSAFRSLPREIWAYWITPQHRSLFTQHRRLSQVAPPRQGLATTDNARFVRYWWEVRRKDEGGRMKEESRISDLSSPNSSFCLHPSSLPKWFPYAKGGGFCRWYGAPMHVVNWEEDGREIKRAIIERYPYLNGDWQWVAKNSQWYGKPGVTWSYLTSGTFGARLLPEGSCFDVAGSALFPEDREWMLAVLNSSVARELLAMINPTVNFQVGDLAQLPFPSGGAELRPLVRRAIEIRRKMDSYDETTPDFIAPMPWAQADAIHHELQQELRDVEHEIDSAVSDLYRIKHLESPRLEVVPLDRTDLARRWISYAISRCGARVIDLASHTISQKLQSIVGDSYSAIDEAVGGIESFLRRRFFPWHVKLYRHRPVYWAFGGRSASCLIHHSHADAQTLRPVLASLGGQLPGGWDRVMDDGIAVNLAPLGEWLADPLLAKVMKQLAKDLHSPRYAWSRTASLIQD